jgi:hypothetical protein
MGVVADGLTKSSAERPEFLAISRDIGWNPDSLYFNGGMFCCRPSERTRNFFRLWHELWLQSSAITAYRDQPSFNAALSRSGLNIVNLPSIYNTQLWLSWTPAAKAKIWHFWYSTGDHSHVLAELLSSAPVSDTEKLRKQIIKAARKATPAPGKNFIAIMMRLFRVSPEIQRKVLIQRSRLTGCEFLRWLQQRLLRSA